MSNSEVIHPETSVSLHAQDELPPVCTDGSYMGFDPQGRLLALNLFDGLLKVGMPIKNNEHDLPNMDTNAPTTLACINLFYARRYDANRAMDASCMRSDGSSRRNRRNV